MGIHATNFPKKLWQITYNKEKEFIELYDLRIEGRWHKKVKSSVISQTVAIFKMRLSSISTSPWSAGVVY